MKIWLGYTGVLRDSGLLSVAECEGRETATQWIIESGAIVEAKKSAIRLPLFPVRYRKSTGQRMGVSIGYGWRASATDPRISAQSTEGNADE